MVLLPKVSRLRNRSMMQVQVRSTERISPHFQRVTLVGDELPRFAYAGPDQAFRMFFPRPGQERLLMPTMANEVWMAQLIMQPVSRRPWARMYTVRAFRPELHELDVEIVLHHGPGGPSPATAWATAVAPGDPVGVFNEGYTYSPPPRARRQLLVGDESALPAILAILEHSLPRLEGDVYLEVPTSADIRNAVVAPRGMQVHWIPRDGPARRPGERALEAVRTISLDSAPDYAWIAGESALATGVRRYLTRDRSIDKSTVTFTGYWRNGHAAPG